MPSSPVLIIGAGIGGLALAACLKARNIPSLIYERAPELKEVGAALGVWPNATRVLHHLNLFNALAEKANVVQVGALREQNGRAMKEINLPKTDVAGVAAHRADLHSVLLSAVPPATISLNKSCTKIEINGDQVRAHFADNTSSPWAQGLIGADGINSIVRKNILNDGEPIYRGYVAWRGVAQFDPGNAVGETWGRGQRFGLIPLGQKRTAWWATANKSKEDACKGTQADWKQEVIDRYSNYHAPIKELLEATPVEGYLCTPIADREGPFPGKSWGKGPTTLLGDAAHPTTPNLGQGACMAIEDAAVLAHALAAIPSVDSAFRVYEASRIGRTANIVIESRKFGKIGQWQNPVACYIRNKMMRFSPESGLRKQFHDLWEYDAWNAPLNMPATA
jgi:2-polyprenyl-6-methoxyphenol hydroxylase-like FAD-dependent oxidoreductase